MASGRREEMRQHALSQAALVWVLGELDGETIWRFIKTGTIETGGGPLRMTTELREKVEAKIVEIQRTGKVV